MQAWFAWYLLRFNLASQSLHRDGQSGREIQRGTRKPKQQGVDISIKSLPLLSVHCPQVLSTMSQPDRDALIAIYNAIGGASWHAKENWDTGADLSQWYGVEVNDHGGVLKQSLTSNNLRSILTFSP